MITEPAMPAAAKSIHFGGMSWGLTHNESNERGGFVRHWESYACTVAVQIHGNNAATFYYAGAVSCPDFDAALKSACRQHAMSCAAAHEILRRGAPDLFRDGGDVKGLQYFERRFPIY